MQETIKSWTTQQAIDNVTKSWWAAANTNMRDYAQTLPGNLSKAAELDPNTHKDVESALKDPKVLKMLLSEDFFTKFFDEWHKTGKSQYGDKLAAIAAAKAWLDAMDDAKSQDMDTKTTVYIVPDNDGKQRIITFNKDEWWTYMPNKEEKKLSGKTLKSANDLAVVSSLVSTYWIEKASALVGEEYMSVLDTTTWKVHELDVWEDEPMKYKTVVSEDWKVTWFEFVSGWVANDPNDPKAEKKEKMFDKNFDEAKAIADAKAVNKQDVVTVDPTG